MAEYGAGTPLRTSAASLWKGQDKTNGFLMKGDRIPALAESFSRLVIDAASPLATLDAITWGNGLWRDAANIDTQPGVLHAQAPAKPMLVGILSFEQGMQSGNPVLNYALPTYSKGKVIRKGLVGYKTALKVGGSVDDYLSYLAGSRSAAALAAVTVYSDWVVELKNAAAGSRIGLFFDDATGFPVIAATAAAAGATFAAYAEVFESENEAIYFDVNL